MARIGNSVYHDICPGDPTCRQFGFIDRNGTPTPMMAASMLYKMHSHNQKPGVSVNPELFREVYTSKYNKVRIFKILKVSKKSRKWIADPKNRKCDAPGSWYCVGQYPPALTELINNRTSFKQLEDFNTKRTAKDDEYNRLVFGLLNSYAHPLFATQPLAGRAREACPYTLHPAPCTLRAEMRVWCSTRLQGGRVP